MKLDRKETQYEGSGTIQQQSFEIGDAAMVAQLLSKLYTNPIKAVIREYTCNAIDAVKEAGGDVETDVTLTCPSILHNYFEVSDTGTGMSHEQVMKRFCTYGSDHKRKTNNMIGGFGVGCKSAFSYTNTFTFVSTYEGMRTTYATVNDEVRGPQVEVLSKTKTDDPNGFKVKIPVQKSDLNDFRSEIHKFCEYLPEIPKVSGTDVEPIEYAKIIDFEGTRYSFVKEAMHNECFIRMGGVLYEVQLKNHLYSIGFSSDVIIDAPIGSYRVSPDRETIIVTPSITDQIESDLRSLQKKLSDDLQSELDSCETFYRASVLFSTVRKSVLKLNPRQRFTWRGKDVKTEVRTGKTGVRCVDSDHLFKPYINKQHSIKSHLIDAVLDCEGYRTRYTNIIKASGFKGRVVLLDGDTPKKRYQQWVRLGKPEVPVLKYSEFKDLIKKVTKSNKRTVVKFKVYRGNKIRDNVDIPVDDNQRRVYVKTESGFFNLLPDCKECLDDISLSKIVKFCGITDEEVIIVPKTLWKRIPDSWVDLEPYIQKVCGDFIKDSHLFIPDTFKYGIDDLYIKGLFSNKYFDVIDKILDERLEINSYTIPDRILDRCKYKNLSHRINKMNWKISDDFKNTYPLIDFTHKNSSIEYFNAINQYRGINSKFYVIS